MATVAVAGGTGGLGRAIVEAVLGRNIYKVIVVTRSANPKFEQETKASCIEVDYNDVVTLKTILEQNRVQTIISTMKVATSGEAQVNLIKAAEQSTATKRFVPTIWGIPFNKERLEIYPTSKFKYQGVQELEKSSLEYTLVYNGYLLDYMGKPHQNTYMTPQAVVLDIPNDQAAIPGDGNAPVVFTHSFDVAKYVARMLDLEKWDRETYIIGDKLTFNEMVTLAEQVKGTRFKVTYDSLELLRSGKVTELPSHILVYKYIPKEKFQAILAILELDLAGGAYDFAGKETLNAMFPDITTTKVQEVMERAWKTT